MKNYYKLIIPLLALFITTSIAGCKSISRYQESIFNDEKKIVKEGDSHTYKTRLGSIKNNETDIKFTSFTGSETIYKFKADEENNITFNFNSTINNGDFKVVLITPEDEIINIIYGQEEGSETILLKKGISRMKLVGNKANGEINIYIDAEKEIKITKTN